jgi:ribosomal protein S18 acetylase RimI-like enzyme
LKTNHCEGYDITYDQTRFDASQLLPLYAQTYWANQRPLVTIEKSLKHSLVYVAFYENKPVAMLRMITDYTTFAYLCDVVVDESHRGKGLGKMILNEAFGRDDVKSLRRISLLTQDAQGLYQQYGFENIEHPERYMEILR